MRCLLGVYINKSAWGQKTKMLLVTPDSSENHQVCFCIVKVMQ